MFLRIEKGSATPLSRQIAQQIGSLCASGNLKAGDRLPSVRELARDLSVNQNTILRVYERLSRDGLLEMRQGQGTFVALNARANASPGQRERLVDELRQVARQCVGLGLADDEIHELLSVALRELHNPPPSKGGARGGTEEPINPAGNATIAGQTTALRSGDFGSPELGCPLTQPLPSGERGLHAEQSP